MTDIQRVPYFDGHNDTLLKLYYSNSKIKINDFIEGNNNYHIDMPKIKKANFIGGFLQFFHLMKNQVKNSFQE